MWIYEKRLIYPIKITQPNPRMAKIIAGLLGSAAGELTASMTYLNQRFHMPDKTSAAILTDIGSEELSHMEMLQSMLMQSLKGVSNEALRAANMEGWVEQWGENSFLADAFGNAWSSKYVGSSGDAIADLTNDMAADATTTKEQPAFPRSRKPLILQAFRHFEGFHKNGIPAII